MKNFKQLIKELPSNKVVVGFGSFQPPTSMHEHLIKSVKRVADNSADYAIYASVNEDKKHNPLPVDRKVYFLNRMFPGTKFQESTEQNIVGLAKKLNEKYKNLVVVVGEDKVVETEKQLNKANGKEFTFESIKVVSTGSRDPDSDLSSGVSGLRMCESAKAGKFDDFKKGLPHTLTEHDSRRLMNEVRKGLGQDPIKEVVEFTRTSVREQYVAGEIFNLGDKVQDDRGVYEIMDRGANYLTVVNESGELSKKWIDKVTAVKTEIQESMSSNPNEISFKGYTTTQFHKEPRALKAFKGTIDKHSQGSIKDGVAILNAIKHTDAYLSMVDGKDHSKAQEALHRIGEFGDHEKYWDDHKPTVKDVVSKQKKDQEVNMSGKNVHESADPVETKKIMMRYKDFINKSASSEPKLEIGEPAANPAPVKSVEPGKKDTESDQDAVADKTQLQNKVGHTLHHDHGNETLRKQKVHYHLGESNNHYDEAEKHLSLANDADAKGDKATFHAHMANHHDAMSEWHESKGRSASADKHAEKADYHHEKSLTVKEDVYTSDTKTKDYMTKDKDGNWVWRKRKIHPKRVTFAASKMGGDPSQQAQQDEAYVSEAADHEHPYNRPHDEPSVSHTKLKAGQHARAPYNRIVFGGALSKMWHAKNKSGQVKAFVNSDAAKKHALSEEVEINEGAADDLGNKIDNAHSDDHAKSIISKAKTKHLQYLHHWNMGLSGARTHKDMPHIKAELTKRGAMLSAKESEKHFAEDKDPCWTGYKQLGVKKKNGKTVPNCVPVKEEIKTYGSWVLKQKSMISKTAAEKSKKKVTKGKTDIADKEAFDAKNAGGTPPFDPFFGR